MNTPHTPTPWTCTVPPSCLLTTRQIRTESGELIADVGTPGEKGVGTIQNVANADRIVACVNACQGINPAAVPAMLAALEEIAMENDDDDWSDHDELIRCATIARHAIAQATTPV